VTGDKDERILINGNENDLSVALSNLEKKMSNVIMEKPKKMEKSMEIVKPGNNMVEGIKKNKTLSKKKKLNKKKKMDQHESYSDRLDNKVVKSLTKSIINQKNIKRL
jgi:hypothetical protein